MFKLIVVSVTEFVVWSVGKDNGSCDDDRSDCEEVDINDEDEEDVDVDDDNAIGESEVLSSVTEVYVTAESAFVNVETVCCGVEDKRLDDAKLVSDISSSALVLIFKVVYVPICVA